MAHLEAITGRYVNLDIDGLSYRIYFEEAGEGPPLICMHTAGADGRQWRHLLNDEEITSRFRVIAFDLPFHGKSTPPGEWWLSQYKLTTKHYAEVIRQFWQALNLEKPILMGCSMAGAIVLKLAIDHLFYNIHFTTSHLSITRERKSHFSQHIITPPQTNQSHHHITSQCIPQYMAI